MLLGATVLCALVLLVLVADKLGARVFQGDADRSLFRCEDCDLRYPRHELRHPSLLICPAGHAVVIERSRVGAGVVGICACLGFLAVALVLMLSGIVPA